jgi:cyanate lyase
MIDPTGKGFAETLATYGVPIKKAVFLVAVGAAVVACIDMVYEVIHEVIDQMDGKYLPGEFFWNYGKTVAKCLIPLTGAIALAD